MHWSLLRLVPLPLLCNNLFTAFSIWQGSGKSTVAMAVARYFEEHPEILAHMYDIVVFAFCHLHLFF